MHALATLTLLFPLLSPAAARAEAAAPAPAADKDCDEAKVEIDIDIDTGLVHAFDGNQWITLDGDLVVYTGGAETVPVALHDSSGEWLVAVATDGGAPVRVETNRGVAQLSIDGDAERVVISSSARRNAAAAMTPVVPDIIIRPKPDCPPSP